MVLLILGMLLGSLLVPLSDRVQQARYAQAEKTLNEEALPALLGYAVSRPTEVYLPCPDCRSSTDCAGGTPNDGVEDRTGGGACRVAFGNLPWVTLGVANADPWGSRFSYQVFEDFADEAGFTLRQPDIDATTEDLNVTRGAAGSSVYLVGGSSADADGAVAVLLSHGGNRYGAISAADGSAQADPPAGNDDEDDNLDGNDGIPESNDFVSRPYTEAGQSVEEFDDIVVWLSAHHLRAFLANAGRLP